MKSNIRTELDTKHNVLILKSNLTINHHQESLSEFRMGLIRKIFTEKWRSPLCITGCRTDPSPSIPSIALPGRSNDSKGARRTNSRAARRFRLPCFHETSLHRDCNIEMPISLTKLILVNILRNWLKYLRLQFGMALALHGNQEEKRGTLSKPMGPIPCDDDPAGDPLRLRGRWSLLVR